MMISEAATSTDGACTGGLDGELKDASGETSMGMALAIDGAVDVAAVVRRPEEGRASSDRESPMRASSCSALLLVLLRRPKDMATAGEGGV